jgi:hypothetical protein
MATTNDRDGRRRLTIVPPTEARSPPGGPHRPRSRMGHRLRRITPVLASEAAVRSCAREASRSSIARQAT